MYQNSEFYLNDTKKKWKGLGQTVPLPTIIKLMNNSFKNLVS